MALACIDRMKLWDSRVGGEGVRECLEFVGGWVREWLGGWVRECPTRTPHKTQYTVNHTSGPHTSPSILYIIRHVSCVLLSTRPCAQADGGMAKDSSKQLSL